MQESKQAFTASGLEQLLRDLSPRLLRKAVACGVPLHDAEDLLQQSFLALVQKADAVNDPERWLAGTLKRQCLMHLRQRRRQLYHAIDSAMLELFEDRKLSAQERVEIRRDLASAIHGIPDRCRTLLRMRYELGYLPGEVAESLGYSPTSMRKVTSRCLAALTRRLVESPTPATGALLAD